MLKLIGVAAALFGGAYMTGVFDHRYERVVGRPAAEVRSGLEDLDIRKQPGEPGTDPSRSGGVRSDFAHERTPTGLVWTVRSGDQVAVRMFADIEPIDDGSQTRLTTRVERGDAPDDVVAPAFRSTGITLGLFSMAVEAELDKLTLPKGASPEQCRAIIERMENDRIDATVAQHATREERPADLKAAMGNTAKDVMRISEMAIELRRNGCDTSGTGQVEPVQTRMLSPP